MASLLTEVGASAHIHLWLGVTLLFFGPAVAFFVIGLLLRDQADWQGWSNYSVFASLATLGLAFFTFVSFDFQEVLGNGWELSQDVRRGG